MRARCSRRGSIPGTNLHRGIGDTQQRSPTTSTFTLLHRPKTPVAIQLLVHSPDLVLLPIDALHNGLVEALLVVATLHITHLAESVSVPMLKVPGFLWLLVAENVVHPVFRAAQLSGELRRFTASVTAADATQRVAIVSNIPALAKLVSPLQHRTHIARRSPHLLWPDALNPLSWSLLKPGPRLGLAVVNRNQYIATCGHKFNLTDLPSSQRDPKTRKNIATCDGRCRGPHTRPRV
mmetsp:Transcript_46834/g.124385  ORF Transcript_46834/g.124385 Transcript_46834/m.124385 type:complete len:236 (-) Transcript_46834:269-976(-)